jgi:putative glycosyltransferase (TIGR04372 family)
MWIDLAAPDKFFEVEHVPPQLTFTREEEAKGKQLLAKMGIPPGAPFVCFHVRDRSYLDHAHRYRSRDEWAYQDYRDCDIHNFMPAVEYLASLGVYVIRMGYMVEKRLEGDEPRVIDYASDYRTDFGDIYLSAKCKFFICSDGGMSSIPWIFNVPVAYTNGVPPVAAAGWRKVDVFITKKLWLRNEKRFITYDEILKRGIDKWFRSEKYRQAGIDIVENTQEEILDAVKELNARLDGAWESRAEDEELLRDYWALFPIGHRNYGNHSRLGSEFLRQNQFLIRKKSNEGITVHP